MIQKGKIGYLEDYKKRQRKKVLIYFGIILAIVIAVLLLFHTTKTVFIVVAILGVMPAAKALVGYMIVLPYAPYEGSTIPKNIAKEGRELFELVISSEERITYIPYLYMSKRKIYLLITLEKKPVDKKKLKRHIQNWMREEGFHFVVEVFEGEQPFLDKIAVDAKNQGESEVENDLDKAVSRILILAV